VVEVTKSKPVKSELKLPKINLKELRAQMRRNKKQRREFLDYYASRVKAGTA